MTELNKDSMPTKSVQSVPETPNAPAKPRQVNLTVVALAALFLAILGNVLGPSYRTLTALADGFAALLFLTAIVLAIRRRLRSKATAA